MTLSARERDIDAAVRATVATLGHPFRNPHVATPYWTRTVRMAFAGIQATRLAASTLSHCGHTQRKAKTDRVHDALRAVVG